MKPNKPNFPKSYIAGDSITKNGKRVVFTSAVTFKTRIDLLEYWFENSHRAVDWPPPIPPRTRWQRLRAFFTE